MKRLFSVFHPCSSVAKNTSGTPSEETAVWPAKRPSFPNFVWERTCGRNSVSRGGRVCWRERGTARRGGGGDKRGKVGGRAGHRRLGNGVPLPSAFPNGVWERGAEADARSANGAIHPSLGQRPRSTGKEDARAESPAHPGATAPPWIGPSALALLRRYFPGALPQAGMGCASGAPAIGTFGTPSTVQSHPRCADYATRTLSKYCHFFEKKAGRIV